MACSADACGPCSVAVHHGVFERIGKRTVPPSFISRSKAASTSSSTHALLTDCSDRNCKIRNTRPVIRYGRIPEEEKVMRILEPSEARLLVEKTLEVHRVVGTYVGVHGETG